MRSRLGVHLAGLLAAAGFPLTVDDLTRLTGRSAAAVESALQDAGDAGELGIVRAGILRTSDGVAITAPDAVAHVVRNLHRGPLAPGSETDPRTQRAALAPFRAALRAGALSALEEWGWEQTPPYLRGAGLPRSMHDRRDERDLLVRLLTDARRQEAVAAADPDAPSAQIDEAAHAIADTATTTADLGDLGALLVAAHQVRPVDGAPPHGVAPVFAFGGDLERARAIADEVRVEPDIEAAYVGEAAARAGYHEGAEIAGSAAAAVRAAAAPVGALLRVAQAVAGTALHTDDPDAAAALAGEARALVASALEVAEPVAEVAHLSRSIFRAARDHERANGATTLATAAAALARAGDDAAAAATADAADDLVDGIVVASLRARTLARLSARLRGRSAALTDRADRLGERAVEAAREDLATRAEIARLLVDTGPATGPDPDPPAVGDTRRAEPLARAVLAEVASSDTLVPRGVLHDAAAALDRIAPDGPAVAAARATVERVADARHGTAMERTSRALHEAVVLAEAAAILDRAGLADEATAAAGRAREIADRIPASARARTLARIAAELLPARTPAVFDLGIRAADDERSGSSRYRDAGAAELVAAAAAGAEAGLGGSEPADADRAARLDEVFTQATRSLRHHGEAAALMRLADLDARAGRQERAERLARDALVAARAPDPVRRGRARAALAAARDGVVSAPGAESPASPPHDSDTAQSWADTAQRWLSDGYPLSDLAALKSADPRVWSRVSALMSSELAR